MQHSIRLAFVMIFLNVSSTSAFAQSKCFVDTRLRSRNGAGPVDEFKHLSTGSLNLCLSKNQNPPLVG
jgi:hypothetical protein